MNEWGRERDMTEATKWQAKMGNTQLLEAFSSFKSEKAAVAACAAAAVAPP